MIENLYSLAFQIVFFAITTIAIHFIVEMRLRKVAGDAEPSGTTAALFKGVLILGCALVLIEVGNVVIPLAKALKRSFPAEAFTTQLFIYLSVFFGLTVLIIVINYWLAILLFTIISKGQKMFAEVKVGNRPAAVVFGVLYISLSLLSASEVLAILDYLVPYPEIPLLM